MSNEDILTRQTDLTEMKKSIELLESKLNNGKFVEEIYDVGRSRVLQRKECETSKLPAIERVEEEKLEMKRLDEMLKLKTREMKEAQMERMQTLEESQQILKEMSESRASHAIKQNAEQFLRLLQAEVSDFAGENVEAAKTGKATKKEKVKCEEPYKKSATFIERNIQLAKCGDGVLSLTDEEKLRLKSVLSDIDKPFEKIEPNDDDQTLIQNNFYVLGNDTKKMLQEIDKKLEDHEKMRFPFGCITNRETRTSEELQEVKTESAKLKVESKTDSSFGKEHKSLKEVDKLLNSLNTATYDEINPLMDEDLQLLIEESKHSLCMSSCDGLSPRSEGNSFHPLEHTFLGATHSVPTKEAMLKLVTVAKENMPNFRFRYEH